jgi:hypothetical protein
MITFISKQNFKEMSNEIKALRSKLTALTHEVNVLQTQVLELNLKRPVSLSSNQSGTVTWASKPVAKKRGRPFGSKNKPAPKTKK